MAAGVPQALLSVPADGFIGEALEFTVSFDNTGPDAGYGPYINLELPAAGVDGDDGISFTSATYLGTPVNIEANFFCTGSYTHPLTNLSTSCTVGTQVVVLQPPYGSFTPTQPAAPILVEAAVSNLADVNAPLAIRAAAGFFLGNDPLANPASDPPIVQASPTSAAYTPILWRLEKVYLGPEDETATGPNFPRQYRIDIDIADGQTISDLDISDVLPPTMQYVQVDSVTTAVGSPAVTAIATPSATTPGGTLTRRLSSATGTTGEQDASLLFTFYVPRLNATGGVILDAPSGNDYTDTNDARAAGSWAALDARDGVVPVTNDLAPVDHRLEEQSIAIQKGAFNVTKGAAADVAVNTPDDVVAYTLDVQVSDYFAFQSVVITDTLGDGLRFQDSFAPTVACTEHGSATSGSFAIANYTVSDNWTDLNGATAPNPGEPAPPHVLNPAPNNGATALSFRLSNQLVALGADGQFVGGGIPNGGTGAGPLANNPPLPFGPTTCQITYRAVLQDQFSDTFPSGDQSIDQGDILRNTAIVDGDVLNVSDLTPSGLSEDDDTGAALQIGRGDLSKTIYAINGNTNCLPGDCSGGANTVIKPGDTVTYRLRLTLPSSDIEQLRLADYLPLPIFDVADAGTAITAFDPTVSATPPPAGTAKFGPSDDFTAESGITPVVSLDALANSVTFTYGNYDDPTNDANTIDILFTVTASFDPFADKLLLTNQLRELETSTNAGDQEIDRIVQLTINEPVLRMRKGVVATNATLSPAPSFALPAGVTVSPANACASRLSGAVTSANLGSTFDSNLTGVDAGDQVTFAIVVENTGSGPNGAFDVRVRDALPAGLTVVPGSLCVNRGSDGASMPFVELGGGLFDPAGGIELTDPGATQGALGPGQSRLTSDPITDGNNIAIVTFNATVGGGVGPRQTLINVGSVYNYANTNSGADFTRTDLTDPATITTGDPSGIKLIVATSEAHTADAPSPARLAIGEIARYRLAVQVPEGTITDLMLRDRLPTGLLYLDDGTARVAFVSNGGGITSAAAGSTPAVSCANDSGNATTLAALPQASVDCALGDLNVSLNATADDDGYASGSDPIFKLGTLTNADNDADAEFAVVEFNALVDNTTTGSNDAGDQRPNDFQIIVSGVNLATGAAVNSQIVEPAITTTKSVSPASGDAGDTVTYTVVLANTGGAAANRTTAFNVVMTDTLPLDLDNIAITSVTAGGTGSATGLSSSVSGNTITVNAASIDSGATVTVVYTARLRATVTPGKLITNTATTTFTSLPGANGTTGNTTGTNTPGAPGTGTGERIAPGAAPNDYVSADSETVTVFVPAPTKSILATSEAHTANSAVVVGEIVRYRLVVRIAEGSSPATQLRDNLPAGLRFLNDGTARLALASTDPGLSSSTLTGAGPQAWPYNQTNIGSVTPSFVIPAGAISGGTGTAGAFVGGDDPVFSLGDLTNTDSDADEEFAIIEFNALVENVAANQSGAVLNNDFTVRFNGSDSATSNVVPVTVAEPVVAINKRALATNGSAVTYEVVASNTGNATAFEVVVGDVLPAQLDLNVASITITPAGGATAGTQDHDDAANRVRFTGVSIPAGGSVTITYQATVTTPGATIVNTATTSYTSLPGATGTAGNPTGSTPGVGGAADGERDGSGGTNDYTASDGETLGSLGDWVWYDSNNNGAQNTGEIGIPNVGITVRWFGPDGLENTADDSVITTTTNSAGNYLVSGLPLGTGPNNYRVTVSTGTLPNGLTVNTFDLDNGTLGPNSNTVVALSSGNANPRNVDFGYRGTASLGDLIWLDSDGNGTRSTAALEPGLPGVSLTIVWYGFDGVAGGGDDVTFTRITNASGAYNVANLPSGNYRVSVNTGTLPTNVTQTYDLNGGLDHAATRTLAVGGTGNDLDFGYRGNSAIGDRVWYDIDGDGVQDANEPGISGLSVSLLWAGPDGALATTADNVTYTTTTDANGNYSFPGLPIFGADDPYRVTVAPSASYPAQTYDNDGTASPNQSTLNLPANTTNTVQDFGYRASATQGLGNFVWEDQNGNGRQDTGEPGIGGVTVDLYNSAGTTLLATTTTNASGVYSFPGLLAGSHQVRFATPAGYAATVRDSAVATDATDSDANLATGFSGAVTVTAGAFNNDVDAGYYRPVSAGDRVWYDIDGDGVQDAGEPGIPGATVTLTWYGPDGAPGGDDQTFTATTDAAGLWTIAGLTPGNYGAAVTTLPAGLTTQTAGVPTFTLVSGTSRTDIDFGYRGTASLGDAVWLDIDGDGAQGVDEGIGGVTVTATWHGPNNNPGGGDDQVFTTTTAPDGSYSFTNLPAGEYRVDVSGLPAGVGPFSDLDGIVSPNTTGVSLTVGQNRTDADFGYRGTGSLGNYVWLDVANPGVQDTAEDGIAGVSLSLIWAGLDNTFGTGDDIAATTATNANGGYSFANLPAGQYRVTVDPASLPVDVAQTYDLDDPTGAPFATANRADTTLTAGENRTDVNFGYRGQRSLGDLIWLDLDGDGAQDAGEPGIPDVAVTLTWFGPDGDPATIADNVTFTTATDASGAYSFTGLPAGAYRVDADPVSLPGGLAPTSDLDGIASANTTLVTIAASTDRNDVDFGYRGTGSIGDTVWLDRDGNQAQDAGEPGIADVTVTLTWAGEDDDFTTAADNVVYTTLTSDAGFYSFGNLPAGAYRVEVDPATLPGGLNQTYDLDGAGDNLVELTTPLGAGEDRDTLDFGYQGTGSIGDRVWFDANGDTSQDASEPGIPGVDVTLIWFGPDGVLGGGDDGLLTLTTGVNGAYDFTGLPAGEYSVDVDTADAPAGSTLTTANDPEAVTLAAGQDFDDADFGFEGTGSIGDRLWLDLDGDGAQDAGEPGMVGIGLTLTWEGPDGLAGNADDVVYSAITGADGAYRFNELPAGDFTLAVTTADLPAGLTATFDLDGAASASVSAVSLTAGQSRDDVDFGYQGAGSIGDRVWLDENGDGSQAVGEPGLGNIGLTLTWGGPDDDLTTTADNATFAATTDASGAYDFKGLPAGEYSVDVETGDAPAGTTLTTANDPEAVTLAAGQDFDDADFGFTGAASIGDRVWNDLDNDGVQDAGETGLAGVTLTITWYGPDGNINTAADNVVYTVVTGANGIYLLDNLPDGIFLVEVGTATLPAGMNPTYDYDNTLDSAAEVTLNGGANLSEVDFGYSTSAPVATSALGDRLWLDQYGDGVQDVGEPGLSGVTVTLEGAGLDAIFGTPDDLVGFAPQITDADGLYQFTALAAGLYRVAVDPASLPAGLGETYELDGTLNGAAVVSLAAAQTRGDVDFGYTDVNGGATAGSIGDRIWLDQDGDGVQDAGETGIPGVTVTLTGAGADNLFGTADDTTASDVTDADGRYGFANLGAGSYRVMVDGASLPAGLNQTYELDASRDGAVTLSLGVGEARSDVDFGYTTAPVTAPTGAIGDLIWLDLDGDGAQDAGEPGLSGVAVNLTWFGADGLPAGGDDLSFSQVTDANGIYTFAGLPAGAYSVVVDGATLPAGLAQTYDLDAVRDGSASVTLAANQTRDDVDFGYRGTGSIGDRVWNDANGDGIQQPAELGFPGVTVTLVAPGPDGVLGTADDATSITTTDANGDYSFGGLTAGTYRVTVDDTGLPANQSYELDGSMDSSTVVSLAAGQDRLDVDFGYTNTSLGPLGSIGDTVWLDLNNNSVQDAGEPGLAGVTVNLFTPDNLVFTQATASDGSYRFSGLPANDYRVVVDAGSLPPALSQTYELDGSLNGSTDVSLAAGEVRDDVDFGYRGEGSIGDYVWDDTNGDGVQDAGEPGISGVTVMLTWAGPDGVLGTADDTTLTTSTDASGVYLFDGLPAGSYRATVDTLLADPDRQLRPTYDLDGGLDSVTSVGLGASQDRVDVDFGFVVPAIDLAITKSDAAVTALAGDAVAYTLTYTNTGNYVATGVVIAETVPANTTFSAAGSSAGWSCADGAAAGTACTFPVGTLARAASASVTFVVRVDAALPAGVGELSNTVTIDDDRSFGDDVNPADNSATELTPLDAAPDLRLTKALAGARPTVGPGEQGLYRLAYSNVGAQTATGVVVTETVPANTTFSAAGSSAGWSCADGAAAGTACTFPVGTLAAGATGQVMFAVMVDTTIAPGALGIVNSASIADDGANGADPTPPNNAATVSSPFTATAVSLLSFTASRSADGVEVRWVTGAELNTWGFELYRSATGSRADAVKVTTATILARGNASGGAEYRWSDTTAETGVRYSYWLVERETGGAVNEYGPAVVSGSIAAGRYTVSLPMLGK